MQAHLFVEHPVAFVDIGDIALVLVEALSGELALLVDTSDQQAV